MWGFFLYKKYPAERIGTPLPDVTLWYYEDDDGKVYAGLP